MHEFHGWLSLAWSAYEDDGIEVRRAVERINGILAEQRWPDAAFEVLSLNGEWYLTMHGLINRRRDEGERLEQLIALVGSELPASWGVVYTATTRCRTHPARTPSGSG